MTKLEELNAVAEAAWDVAYEAADAAYEAAYEAELKKTQEVATQ